MLMMQSCLQTHFSFRIDSKFDLVGLDLSKLLLDVCRLTGTNTPLGCGCAIVFLCRRSKFLSGSLDPASSVSMIILKFFVHAKQLDLVPGAYDMVETCQH